ncbi:CotH kinase family protein [uncultured Ruminococcus sp.]|uniref:CotH kinase family protein n=1 Tax=uncultured Ruminococcus sp. TaxID=165186 RepID=UPI00292D4AA2|nr:CotH kinase family protein [uncultured Ruminococcus sp.]
MKRTLALILALTALFSFLCIPTAANAAENSTVPKIEITTDAGNGLSLEKADGYVGAHIKITDADGSMTDDAITLKVRGNSTAMEHVTKKSFNFKFAKKTEVLGMGKGKKWAMLANCFDPTLLRNYLAFDLAQELDLPYTSQQRYAELWLDGSYRGCYTVYEPVQEGRDRVDIDIESNDGKKDFLLEYESSRTEADVSYVSAGGLRFAMSDPDEPNDDQLAYVTDVLTNIVNTLINGSEEEIRQVIDVDSFAKFYLLNEYAKTGDFGLSSVFFFYKDGVLYAGPAWDYDLALGNLNGDLNSTAAKQGSRTDGIMQADKNFYRYLTNKDWFQTEIKRVYAQHYDTMENISADGGRLDTLRAENQALFDRNFKTWSVSRWWLNYQKPPLETYDDNYNFLKNWCAERHRWLSDYYGLYRYSYLRGDSDGNGEVNILDATLIQRVAANLQSDDDGMITLRAALSGDTLSITDATCLQRHFVQLLTPYPIGETAETVLYK